ncbi:MAG: hypothetical protein AB7E47_17580 [Desulfovibrionaceae bacterium]
MTTKRLKTYALAMAVAVALASVVFLGMAVAGPDVARDGAPSSPSSAAARTRPVAVGEVVGMRGQVVALSQLGTRYLLRGEPVYVGDTVRTGETGWLDLYLADGARVAMGPGAQLRIDAFAFDVAAPGAGQASLRAEHGLFRVASGAIGLHGAQGLALRTPLATWDVRGAEVFVSAGAATEVGGVRGLQKDMRVLVTAQGGNQDIDHAHSMVFVTPDVGVGKPAPLRQRVWEPFRTGVPMVTVRVPRVERPDEGTVDGDATLRAVIGRLAQEKRALVERLDPYQPLRHDPHGAEATLERIGLYRQAARLARQRLSGEQWETLRHEQGGL